MILLRRWGFSGTDEARSYAGTIREKLLKIGAQMTVSVRCVAVRLAAGYPFRGLLREVHANLPAEQAPARAGP